MKVFFFILLQYVMPQHMISRLIGKLARCELPWVKNPLITQFVNIYRVNLAEAQITDIREFKHFNDFFTRQLKPEARPIDGDSQAIVSPADGAFSQLGTIRDGRIFQAKGQDYSALELLGGDSALAKQFHNGRFATIYLSPTDYHRVHMPITGTVQSMSHVPGDLFSVNQTTAENVPRLFARNERAITLFDTEIGPMAMVLVGAVVVASIETVWAGQIAPTGKQITTTHYQNDPIVIEKGAEMGRFKLGSTVVVLFPENTMTWETAHTAGTPIQLGNKIGTIH